MSVAVNPLVSSLSLGLPMGWRMFVGVGSCVSGSAFLSVCGLGRGVRLVGVGPHPWV